MKMRLGEDNTYMVKMDDHNDSDEGPSTRPRPACWEQTASVEELESD